MLALPLRQQLQLKLQSLQLKHEQQQRKLHTVSKAQVWLRRLYEQRIAELPPEEDQAGAGLPPPPSPRLLPPPPPVGCLNLGLKSPT